MLGSSDINGGELAAELREGYRALALDHKGPQNLLTDLPIERPQESIGLTDQDEPELSWTR